MLIETAKQTHISKRTLIINLEIKIIFFCWTKKLNYLPILFFKFLNNLGLQQRITQDWYWLDKELIKNKGLLDMTWRISVNINE